MFGLFTFSAIPQQYRSKQIQQPAEPRSKTNRKAGARTKTKAMQYMTHREFNDCITNKAFHPNYSELKNAIIQSKISTYKSIPRSVRPKVNKQLWKRPEVNDWLVGLIMDMTPEVIRGRKRKDRCSDIKLHELEQMVIDYYMFEDLQLQHESVDPLNPKMLTAEELQKTILTVTSYIATAKGTSEIALRLEYQQQARESQ